MGSLRASRALRIGTTLTDEETEFIQSRDSFYMATVTENGWPYLQHRGGAPGFLRVLGPNRLAFADYKGNRQMLSTGNVEMNDRVNLFLMDYPSRSRLKILGHARVEDARGHPELIAQFAEPAMQKMVERIFFIEVVGFNWNCSQHITPRFTLAEVERAVAPLKERIARTGSQTRQPILQMNPRPPLPPFTEETARQKVQAAEDAWNSRDPERVSLAYTEDTTEWRNRSEFVTGRAAVGEFLRRKWNRELDYRLKKELWAFLGNRIAVRFEYEFRDDSGQWYRAYGNENWEFDEQGYMKRRFASINDLPIKEADRKFRWERPS